MRAVLNAVEQRRASFLRVFGGLATSLALILALVQVANQRWDLALVNMGAAAACGLVPMLTAVGYVRIAAGGLIVIVWLATSFGVVEGGLAGPTVGYVALLPIAASLASGPRLGAIALGVGLATVAAIAFGGGPWGAFGSPVATSLTGGLLVALVAAAGLVFARLTDRLTRSLEASRQAARASDLAKSRLLANCSHDLRTPLNAVLGYTELLREEAVDGGRQAEVADLDRIDQAARTLLGRVNRVLELARIEAERVKVEPQQVKLLSVLKASANGPHSLAAELGPRHEGLDEADVSATVDPAVLGQLVDALVESVDAEGGADRLWASLPQEGWLRIEAKARSADAPVAIIADAVAARLATHLGGRAGGGPGLRWAEVPIA